MEEVLVPIVQFLIDPSESHCPLYDVENSNSLYEISASVFHPDSVEIF